MRFSNETSFFGSEGIQVMAHHRLTIATVVAVLSITTVTRHADGQVGLERKIVLQQDAAIPGYETVLAEVSIAVGGREGRHWHSGTLVGYILEGELTLELEGQPTKIVKAGEAVLIEPRQVHPVIPNRVRAAGAALPLCACGAHDTSACRR
jgi:quercetin dioxygenase-like cupin family protein